MLRMQLLAVVRLSDLTDEITRPSANGPGSPPRPSCRITRVVGLAEDLDVSGAVSPFDRPQLGTWLARADEWDGLLVAKYDRLTRSLLDFLPTTRASSPEGSTNTSYQSPPT
jgi:hypothetical protein